jgi:spermidine synthase
MQSGNSKKTVFLAAIGLIGSAALTSQILLIREILNAFSGNELLYGLTIFLWLVLYSLGSGVLGRLSHFIKHRLAAFITLQTILALLLPAEIFYARIAKNLFGVPFGSLVDLTTTIFILFLLLAPITLILGFQFSLGSLLLYSTFEKNSFEISRVYIFEAIGSILGGLVLSYILIFFLNAFQIAAILTALISISFIALGRVLSRKTILIFGGGFLIIALFLLAFANYYNLSSTRSSLKNYELAEVADSPYGRIIISEYKGSYNFYENGGLLFSTADHLSNEETAHLSLLMHPDPQKVLLIGGGVSGITDELLKYPLRQLDYLELDYKMIKLAKKFTRLDPKVKIFTIDGVKYIRETEKKYDVIIINLPDPTTALLNRFYTLEFFRNCKRKLTKGGILTFSLGTSGSYMGRELKLLNQSIYRTLASAFQYTSVIPGNHNYFFGSENKLLQDRNALLRRWEQRNIQARFFQTNSLFYILWPDKVKYVRETIDFDANTPLNTEFNPVSYYYGLLIWSSYFYSPLKNLFYALMKIKFLNLFIIIIAALLLLKIISAKFKRLNLPAIVALLGFTGMSVQLVIIYAFQSLHGYVYQTIGLLTTAFMAGLAVGSFLIYSKYNQIQDPLQKLKSILGLLLLNLAVIFMFLRIFPLPLASFLLSLPIGAAFPLAVKIQEHYRTEIGGLGGILYGSDLLGGALAALVTTIFFIPIYGILQTFMLAILFGVAALVISYS